MAIARQRNLILKAQGEAPKSVCEALVPCHADIVRRILGAAISLQTATADLAVLQNQMLQHGIGQADRRISFNGIQPLQEISRRLGGLQTNDWQSWIEE